MLLQAQVTKPRKPKSDITTGNFPIKPAPVNAFTDTAQILRDTSKVRIVLYAKDGESSYLTFENGYMVTVYLKYKNLTQPIKGNEYLFTPQMTAIAAKQEDIYDVRPFQWK